MLADALQDIDEIGVEVDSLESASHQQALDEAHALGTELRPGESSRPGGQFPGPTRLADTVAGAHASARLYSLIECAKANGLEPYAYLRHVFTELPKAQSLADIEALLPTRLDPAALARDSLQELFPAARQ